MVSSNIFCFVSLHIFVHLVLFHVSYLIVLLRIVRGNKLSVSLRLDFYEKHVNLLHSTFLNSKLKLLLPRALWIMTSPNILYTIWIMFSHLHCKTSHRWECRICWYQLIIQGRRIISFITDWYWASFLFQLGEFAFGN